MKPIAFLIMLTCSFSCFADSVLMGLSTHHPDRYFMRDGWEVPFNELNSMVAIEREGLVLGVMENSFYKNSLIIGKQWKLSERFGVLGMVATGYNDTTVKTIAGVVPSIYLTVEAGPLVLMAIPTQAYVLALKIRI